MKKKAQAKPKAVQKRVRKAAAPPVIIGVRNPLLPDHLTNLDNIKLRVFDLQAKMRGYRAMFGAEAIEHVTLDIVSHAVFRGLVLDQIEGESEKVRLDKWWTTLADEITAKVLLAQAHERELRRAKEHALGVISGPVGVSLHR